MRILLAEDDLLSLRRLQATLIGWGYDVAAATDGAEALRLLQAKDAPRLMILDWMMPGLDGLEVCREVRAMPLAVPAYILLLTARGGKEDIVEGLDAGADDYLTKPFDLEELRARLRVG